MILLIVHSLAFIETDPPVVLHLLHSPSAPRPLLLGFVIPVMGRYSSRKSFSFLKTIFSITSRPNFSKRDDRKFVNSFQSRANWAFDGVFGGKLVSYDAFSLCRGSSQNRLFENTHFHCLNNEKVEF